MKKTLLLIVAFILCLTGCGVEEEKTMSCTYEFNRGNIKTMITYNVDYLDNAIKKVKMKYDYRAMQEQHNDGIDTGTDGTTSDTEPDNDGIIDGIIGSAIDTVINEVYNTVLDVSGLRDRHTVVQSDYSTMPGFSIQNVTDNTDNDYSVTYIIDYDIISDSDLERLNLTRDIETLRSNYVSQGLSCK